MNTVLQRIMKQILPFIATSLILLLTGFTVKAQEDIMSRLDTMVDNETNYVEATFKSSRIVNGHSIEQTGNDQLHFRISHRFGQVNRGWRDFWGLDNAIMYLSLEYGISDRLMVGLGRTSELKTYHGFSKYAITRQSAGARNMPVSISLHSSISVNSIEWNNPQKESDFVGRMSYSQQLPVARKFNENLSLQITPTFIHRNLVENPQVPNDIYSLGMGGSLRLTKWVRFNAEYFYLLTAFNSEKELDNVNNLSLGFDIHTGGHVFQLHFSNSRSMIEPYFIGETTNKWLDGGIYFGFNILRVFAL
ncbi:MAG: DUF5777 family beta-barrel protein [Bacteroidota bacterium]